MLVAFLLFFTFTWALPVFLLPFQVLFRLFHVNVSTWWVTAQGFLRCVRFRHQFVRQEPLIEKGFILPNHRSFFDFAFDPVTARANILGRWMAFLAVFPGFLCGHLHGMFVFFKRKSLNRHQIFQKMVDNIEAKRGLSQRLIFYPEGTRSKHLTLKDVAHARETLKAGMLKCVYEAQQYPVQIMLTNNKECIFNEKNGTCAFGVRLRTVIDKPIDPRQFGTFEEFYAQVAQRWFDCWQEVYGTK